MYFLFDPNRIISEIDRLKNISGELSGASDDVRSVERALDSDSYQTVLDRLKIYENNLSQTGKRMDGLSQGLSLVRDEYFNTENKIHGKKGALDWLKLLHEGKEKATELINWLEDFLHGNGSYDPDTPWIVATGGHSISLLSDLLGGRLPYSYNANGLNGLYYMGDSREKPFGDVFELGEISRVADWHLFHYTESENAGFAGIWDHDNMYTILNERFGSSILDGSVSFDFFGIGSTGAAGGLFNGEISVNAGESLLVDGKFDPGNYVDVSINCSVANGSLNGQLGTDDVILNGGLSGSAISANAGAQLAYGRMVQDDGDVVHGISGGIDVGASLLHGEVGGSFNIFGIEFSGTVNGDLGSAGITAGGEITTGSVGINLGAGLVAGVGFNVNVDWTGFEMPEIDLPDWELPELDMPDWLSW